MTCKSKTCNDDAQPRGEEDCDIRPLASGLISSGLRLDTITSGLRLDTILLHVACHSMQPTALKAAHAELIHTVHHFALTTTDHVPGSLSYQHNATMYANITPPCTPTCTCVCATRSKTAAYMKMSAVSSYAHFEAQVMVARPTGI